MDKDMKQYFAFLAMFLPIGPATGEAPPAAPLPAVAASLDRFTAGLTTKNADLYASALADDVKVTENGQVAAKGKAEWMTVIRKEFARPYRSIKVEGLFQGFTYTPAFHALLIERWNEATNECCAFHRAEIIDFRDDKIVEIEISPSLNTQVRNDGNKNNS